MTSKLSGTSDATVVRAPKEISSLTAAEAAALFDPDVRDVLAMLERSRKTTDLPAA